MDCTVHGCINSRTRLSDFHVTQEINGPEAHSQMLKGKKRTGWLLLSTLLLDDSP